MKVVKRAGLWERLKRLWHKWRGKRVFEGPTMSEDEVADAFLNDYGRTIIAPLGPNIVAQFAVEANKVGLPPEHLPYVFWLWNQRGKGWPEMSRDRKFGLLWGRQLVIDTGRMPNYRAAMDVPPAKFEKAVDEVLLGVAWYIVTPLSAHLLNGMVTMLRKWGPKMAKATEKDLDPRVAATYLEALAKTYIGREPHLYAYGALTEKVLLGLLG